jgi:hypothetical protein
VIPLILALLLECHVFTSNLSGPNPSHGMDIVSVLFVHVYLESIIGGPNP